MIEEVVDSEVEEDDSKKDAKAPRKKWHDLSLGAANNRPHAPSNNNLKENEKNSKESFEKPEICKFFVQNRCKFGQDCKNSHDLSKVQRQPRSRSRSRSRSKPYIKSDNDENGMQANKANSNGSNKNKNNNNKNNNIIKAQ